MLIKRILFCTLFVAHSYFQTMAQEYDKKPIASDVYDQWPFLYSQQISNDGKFFAYQERVGQHSRFFIQSVQNTWNRSVGSKTIFLSDKRNAVTLKSDSVLRLELGTDKVNIVSTKVSELKVDNSHNWIAMLTLNKILKLYNVKSNRFLKLPDQQVLTFCFDKSGSLIIMESISDDDSSSHQLNIVNLKTGIQKTIWGEEGIKSKLGNLSFDPSGKSAAFLLKRTIASSSELCVLDLKSMSTTILNQKQLSIPQDLSISFDLQPYLDIERGRVLLTLDLVKKDILQKIAIKSSVDIWHYKDEFLPSSSQPADKDKCLAAYYFKEKKLILLEDPRDRYTNAQIQYSPESLDKYLLKINYSNLWNKTWHTGFRVRAELVNTYSAANIIVLDSSEPLRDIVLAPNQKFVVWYNESKGSYYSFEIRTRKISILSSKIPHPLYNNDKIDSMGEVFGIAGWLSDINGILVYDRYDIWLLDLNGVRLPVNITSGYGRKNAITLGFLNPNGIYTSKQDVILAGFNSNTKDNGFLKVNLTGDSDPITLSMEPCTYYIPRLGKSDTGIKTLNENFTGDRPLKAKNVDVYLLRKMSAASYPNFVMTRDFKSFSQLTKLEPQKKYNWLTSELLTWSVSDNSKYQGILYKPENFDPTKKYPVIFQIYRERSSGLNMFMSPDRSNAMLNIPQYVSNGYLVFLPDIHYKKGTPGEDALRSIQSAITKITKFDWVDSTKLGLQGVSFGGYETNYIIANETRFAAACAGASISNISSAYGSLYSGDEAFFMYEHTMFNLGATPYEHPDLYLKNSPIFYANKIKTPLLLWHGDVDFQVPFSQSVEMFLSMRRANKKVWLLQYNGDGHAIGRQNEADLDVRMRQFFDHYLKDFPAPIWITNGRPARLKEQNDALDFEKTETKP
jgi:hypothetical protein